MASNFQNTYPANVIGLWDFLSGNPGGDTGLADGVAQDGTFSGATSTAGGWMNTGVDGRLNVTGDDAPFQLTSGTVIAEFRQFAATNTSEQTVVSRGEAADGCDEGFFSISVLPNGAVRVMHSDDGSYIDMATTAGFADPNDVIKVTYSWNETGVQVIAENVTAGTSESGYSNTPGMTFDITDNDGQNFSIGAREADDGAYDQHFNGGIDYIAVLDDAVLMQGDGIVEGNGDDNLIDTNYMGDPEGDRIDNGDAVLPGEGPQDDIVDAGAGDDTVVSGLGDDVVYAGSGSDDVSGGTGDDVLYGDGNAPLGGAGGTTREVFEWDRAPDPDGPGDVDDGDDLSGGFALDTGNVTVTYSAITDGPGVSSTYEGDPQNINAIDTGGIPADSTSGLSSVTGGSGTAGIYRLEFSDPVENVSFRINDVDGDGAVRVLAFAPDGSPVEVVLSGGSNVTLSDTNPVDGNDTATSNGGYADETNPTYSVLVTIPGPIGRFQVEHTQDGPDLSGVALTDVFFDALLPDAGPDGDDTLDGGDGDDMLFGGGGDDSLLGGDGADMADGGDGDDLIDTRSDGPQLPDRGFPSYNGLPAVPADGDIFDDRDTVDGGAGDDTILTGDDQDIITGGAGEDSIDGGLDDDQIDGGADNDFIVGGEGADEILGGSGDDTIYGGLAPTFPDVLNIRDDGSAGPADPDPTNGMDVIDGGDGNDLVFGQDDDDVITGGAGDDTLDGGIDDDDLSGQDGDDQLIGGQGIDTISGGAGNDEIDGGSGADDMSGGDDRDTFINITAGDRVDGGEGFTSDPADDLDTLDLRGSAEAENPGGSLSVTYDAGNPENGTVTYFDSAGVETGTVDFFNIEVVVPCFTPGTKIATPKGERNVEDLRMGDRVITRDNGIQEIRWIGKRQLSGQELRKAPHLNPVLIQAGALGNGLPERDMMVSPNHRVLVANDKTTLYFEEREVLVAAKHLTGLDGVDVVDICHVEYIHFMFDSHEVVLSDGAWTESFQPGQQSMDGLGNAQRNEIYELFPELRTREGLEQYQSARKSLKKHEASLLTS